MVNVVGLLDFNYIVKVMNIKEQIEEILLTDYQYVDCYSVQKLLDLFSASGRSEQLLAVAEYVYNHFDDSSSKAARDYLQDFLSQ
jgi:hypothetical protein